jgi:hypothetical protein
MPFENSLAHAFTPTSIRNHAPAESGVYGISNAREWIYIGATDNIQGELLAHLQETGTALLTRQPKGFVYELCTSAARMGRHDRLVTEYGPVCNRTLNR